jgi:hypothetical protein
MKCEFSDEMSSARALIKASLRHEEEPEVGEATKVMSSADIILARCASGRFWF